MARGDSSETFEFDPQNKFGASRDKINGRAMKPGDTIQVNISKRHKNQNITPIESHIVTIPGDNNNTLASGGI